MNIEKARAQLASLEKKALVEYNKNVKKLETLLRQKQVYADLESVSPATITDEQKSRVKKNNTAIKEYEKKIAEYVFAHTPLVPSSSSAGELDEKHTGDGGDEKKGSTKKKASVKKAKEASVKKVPKPKKKPQEKPEFDPEAPLKELLPVSRVRTLLKFVVTSLDEGKKYKIGGDFVQELNKSFVDWTNLVLSNIRLVRKLNGKGNTKTKRCKNKTLTHADMQIAIDMVEPGLLKRNNKHNKFFTNNPLIVVTHLRHNMNLTFRRKQRIAKDGVQLLIRALCFRAFEVMTVLVKQLKQRKKTILKVCPAFGGIGKPSRSVAFAGTMNPSMDVDSEDEEEDEASIDFSDVHQDSDTSGDESDDDSEEDEEDEDDDQHLASMTMSMHIASDGTVIHDDENAAQSDVDSEEDDDDDDGLD